MSGWERYSRQNRRAWNEIAEVRSAGFEGARPGEFFRDGGITLDGRAVKAMGDVAGKRLLHVMCATGEETLSWSVLGADAVGVDISDRQIAIAREKAAAAGLPVRFEAADVGDLPDEFAAGAFDSVYTGGGVLVWIPDLERWAQVIAAALKPGGRFVLWDGHPVAGILWGHDGIIEIEDDYFRRSRGEESVGWWHFSGGEAARETKYEFLWPLGDIITALVRAGLTIEEVAEYPSGERWRWGDQAEEAQKLPGMVLVVATRER
jgi:SAM-dependent methyltransferase